MSNLAKKLLTASTQYVPTIIGEAWGGGFYAGRMRVNGQAYAVVASPLALGYNSSVLFSTTSGKRPSGLSPWDGNLNHGLMVAEGLSNYPAAQFCAGLSIGGYTDWHIPAEFEQDICYRAFRPANPPITSIGENQYADPQKGNYVDSDPAATTIPAFVAGGSDEYVANFFLTSSNGGTSTTITIMNFNGGARANTNTNANRMVRATRLVRING